MTAIPFSDALTHCQGCPLLLEPADGSAEIVFSWDTLNDLVGPYCRACYDYLIDCGVIPRPRVPYPGEAL